LVEGDDGEVVQGQQGVNTQVAQRLGAKSLGLKGEGSSHHQQSLDRDAVHHKEGFVDPGGLISEKGEDSLQDLGSIADVDLTEIIEGFLGKLPRLGLGDFVALFMLLYFVVVVSLRNQFLQVKQKRASWRFTYGVIDGGS